MCVYIIPFELKSFPLIVQKAQTIVFVRFD